jgi:hypothetical protein
MDAVYFLKNSPNGDVELRYSLRSLERYAPHIRKVWIFGDDPGFLPIDTKRIERVPQSATARVIKAKTPVCNFFILTFLASIIPDLEPEFIRLSDDYILTAAFGPEMCRRVRYLKNLADTKNRGRGKWKESLWRSFDLLKKLGLPGYNFETHVPAYMRKEWIMDAFCDLRKFVKADRYLGLMGNTEILNHAHAKRKLTLTRIADENSRFGFWGKPPTRKDIEAARAGKTFFNFDDAAFGPGVLAFLKAAFPRKSVYEK